MSFLVFFSNRCEVISLYGFGLTFPDDYWWQASFHVTCWPFYVLSGKLIQFLSSLVKIVVLLLNCVFSSENFMVSALIFMFNIFWVNFYMWYKIGIQFHFLYVITQFSQHHLWRDYSSPIEYSWLPYQILSNLICREFYGFSFVSLIYVFIMSATYVSSLFTIAGRTFRIRKCDAFSIILSQEHCDYLRSLVASNKFKGFFYFCGKCHCNLDKIYIFEFIDGFV